MDKISHTTFFT